MCVITELIYNAGKGHDSGDGRGAENVDALRARWEILPRNLRRMLERIISNFFKTNRTCSPLIQSTLTSDCSRHEEEEHNCT